MKLSAFIISTLFTVSSMSVVKWLPNTSFNLKINFKDGELPCSKQTVVFPETLITSIKLESRISVGGIILPENGVIFLMNDQIDFGPDPKENCEVGNAYYIDKSMASWNQPDVWSSPKFNKATPDAERVPCYDDVVEFPVDAQFTIMLPDVTQSVRELRINGQRVGSRIFRDYILKQLDQSQQFVLNTNMGTGVEIETKVCLNRGGCPCQDKVLKIDCSSKFCPVPTCEDPVKPIGHCCEICGGVLSFAVDKSFDLIDFKEFVEEAIAAYGKDSLIYHIGRLPSDQIQLIVVDNYEYTESSVEVVNKISYSMNTYWVHGEKNMLLSGSPLDKSGLGAKIVISTLFVVILVMGAIYVYHYYDMPEFRNPIRGNKISRRALRFQRRTDSVVTLTRRDSETPTTSGTAFRNPLYDSKRGRVNVAEPVAEE